MAEVVAPVKTAEPLLSTKNKKIFKDGLWDNNPISYQIMGICSALAVTTQVNTAMVMAVAGMFVLAMSSLFISLMRNAIPARIRIIVQLAVVSTFVITVDQVLKAYFYDLDKQLSVFVGLIITNTLVMARLEGFSMGNPPWKSFLDGLGNGLGYGGALLVVATIREILGSGTFMGFHIIPQFLYDHGYINNGMMVLSPGAFFVLGMIVWLHRSIAGYVEAK